MFSYLVVERRLLTGYSASPISTPVTKHLLSVSSKPKPVLDVWGIEAEREIFSIQEFEIRLQTPVCSCAGLGKGTLPGPHVCLQKTTSWETPFTHSFSWCQPRLPVT